MSGKDGLCLWDGGGHHNFRFTFVVRMSGVPELCLSSQIFFLIAVFFLMIVIIFDPFLLDKHPFDPRVLNYINQRIHPFQFYFRNP